MCGICGVIEKTDANVDLTMMQRMANAMIHRGPDDERFWLNGSVGFGFRRLSIVDLNHGYQPMANETESIWVVCNGEIYNHQELRQQLIKRGHRFRSRSDIEVIVHLYEEHGIDCLEQLRGMFALAIYDCHRETLYLARDYFGIKPLFYTNSADEFMFASEVKSILASKRVSRKVNMQSLWDYLTFQYVPDPNTMLEGVLKVPAAHYMKVHKGTVSTHRYWQLEYRPDESKSLSYFVEGIEYQLRKSVHAHMNGEGPRGAFLSSGIDSSAIVALMAEREHVSTFSIGFDGANQHMNEPHFARNLARELGTDHHSVEISAKQYQDVLLNIVYHQDDPVADPSAVGLYFVSELASSYVKTVLSGEGADEIFGGYPIYHEPFSLRVFDVLPPKIRASLGRIATLLPKHIKGRSFLERGAAPLQRRFVGNAKIWTDDVKPSMLAHDANTNCLPSWRITDPIYASTSSLDDVTRMQIIDLHTWLPGDILMKADKMTMAHSVELRVPFLDRDLFEFAATLSTRHRIRSGITKYALRQAMQRVLPKEVYTRPKLGFPVPLADWLRGPMYDFAHDVIHTGELRQFFDMTCLERLIDTHRQGPCDEARTIWTVITFALWHQIFIEGIHPCSPQVSPRVEVRRRRMQHGQMCIKSE